jgi:hypothetical protein
MKMPNKDFEVHVGFPKNATELSGTIKSQLGNGWKEKPAIDAVRPSQCFPDPHSVPGSLGLLLTKHVSSITAALELADAVAKLCSSNPSVRIEVEEVLLVQLDELDRRLDEPHAFVPQNDCIPHGQIVLDTPPYEIHFGVHTKEGSLLGLTTQDVFDKACWAGVAIDEAVRFTDGRNEKVILTKFIDDLDELNTQTPIYGKIIRDAFRAIDKRFELKLVSERIILCAEPIAASVVQDSYASK